MMDLSFYNHKKVFITGHTGFKGTWLCRTLLRAGADVTGFALNPPTKPSLFILSRTGEEMRSIHGDVRDGEALLRSLREVKPEIVFHLAAQPIVRLSYVQPVDTFLTNVMGTVDILEAVRHTSSVRSFVNVTTDKVYRNKEWVWGYRENEELCGLDPYSSSKSCSELVTYSYKQSFFHDGCVAISTARSGNVVGGGDFASDRIIPDCIRSLKEKRTILVRNPNSTRPYQHVLECLSGYLLLAMRQYEDGTFAGAYNFGPDDASCVTTGELVRMFCDAWGSGAVWQTGGGGGPHEANFLKLDCSKAKSVLGWRPKWCIKEALGHVVAWEKTVEADENAAKAVDDQIDEYFWR